MRFIHKVSDYIGVAAYTASAIFMTLLATDCLINYDFLTAFMAGLTAVAMGYFAVDIAIELRIRNL